MRQDAPVAQLDRAPGFEPVGRGFKSLRAHQSFIGGRIQTHSAPVAQLDRALASGAKGRRFESCRARHPKRHKINKLLRTALIDCGQRKSLAFNLRY